MGSSFSPFQFESVPSFFCKWGAAARLGEIMAEGKLGRGLLLVTDIGLRLCGVLDAAFQSLENSGFEIVVLDAVVADPPEAVLLDCTAIGKASRIEAILGLGGGSSMDIANVAAVLLANDRPLSEMYGIGKVAGDRLPLVQMPTTAGTGSKVTNISIITTGATIKLGIVSRQLYADRVLLYAELTVGLPRVHTAETGIDAMVHAVEAYMNRQNKNPVSDALARDALRLLSGNLVADCEDASDRAARKAVLLAAMLARQAFANAPVAAVHAFAYPLGGHYHIPHGLSNALMLGPVLRVNIPAAEAAYADLLDVVAGPSSRPVAERATCFFALMEELMDRSGAPRRLRDVKVERDRLPTLATDAMKQQRLLVNSPVGVTEADALALYEQAF